MVITDDGDWSSQASRTISLFSTSWCSTFQYNTVLDPHELVANILASRDICEENGKIVYNVTFIYDLTSNMRKVSFSYSRWKQ